MKLDYEVESSEPRCGRRRKMIFYAVIFCVLLMIYLLLPVLAGAGRLGDRRGPMIYPETLHRELYILGWELAGHEGKPRALIGAGRRPLFYPLGE